MRRDTCVVMFAWCVMFLLLGGMTQAQFLQFEVAGPEVFDSSPTNFNIPYQKWYNFTVPGSSSIQSGQYALAQFKSSNTNTNYASYTEFQNQNDNSVWNPPCDRMLFGDPEAGLHKNCYKIIYAAASAESTYVDTTHLQVWWLDPIWGSPVNEGSSWNPWANDNIVYTVRFGANGQYHFTRVSGTFWCKTDFLGDPLPGVTKQCNVLDHADVFLSTSSISQNGNGISTNKAPNGLPYGTWVWCAHEGDNCPLTLNGVRMQTPTYVRFGKVDNTANTGTIIRLVDTGDSFPCTSSSFTKDPAPGYTKSCWFFQPNIMTNIAMAVGEWRVMGGDLSSAGLTYGVTWSNSKTYPHSDTSTFAQSLAEAVKVGYKVGKAVGGKSSGEITITSTQAWTTSEQWTKAVTTTTQTSCYAPICTAQLWQWHVIGSPELTTAGGMTVPAIVQVCYSACVEDLSFPICSPGTCSKSCTQSSGVISDECCVCTQGETCDFSMCHYL